MTTVLLAMLVSLSIQSQEWIHDMENGTNLYETKAQFESEWGEEGYVKGRGYKQFHRWFNFWEPRLYPSGERSSMSSTAHLDGIKAAHAEANRDGGDWESLGLEEWVSSSYGPGNGRVNCIAFEPGNSQVMYAGTPAGGLWKSTNGGNGWTPMTDHLPTLGVSGIVVREDDPNTIYIATGDSDASDTYSLGIFKSEDGGDTWTTAGLTFLLSQNVKAHRLMAVPGSPDIMFAGTNAGLYKTTNGGFTWINVLNENVRDLEFKPGDPNTVYASSHKFYISEDGGDSFMEISGNGLPSSADLGRTAIAVSDAEPEWIYLLMSDDTFSAYTGLYRSIDGGETWDERSDSPNILSSAEDGNSQWGQAWYDMEIAVSDEDPNRIIVGAVNLWESDNGGTTWDLNAFWTWPGGGTNYVHADIHHLDYHEGLLWCGSDGGVFRSANEGASFTDLSDGLSISQFYRLGVFAGGSNRVSCGAQDCGTNLMVGSNWTHVLGADGMETIIHPTDDDIMWASSQYGGLNKSSDGGDSFQWAASGINEDGAWVTPYIMSPANPDVMYAGFENVWRSTDGASSWQVISDFNNEQLRSLAMGLIDPNTIYAASYGNLYKTTNAGGDWENISFGLSDEAITYIAVDPMDVDRVWITHSGFEEGEKVYYSDNGGDTWQNISDNLPNCPINCVVFDSSTDEGIYVGTDLGVYYRSEELANWHPFMDGLPNVIVSELEINYGDGKILAATFGRGLWRSDLWQMPTESPEAAFEMSQHYICVGNELQFWDVSQENAPGWDWTFEGGTPAISDEVNPIVTYDEPGTYDVTLEVSNSAGTTDLICEDCVIVYDSIGEVLPLVEGFENSMNLADLNWYTLDDDLGNGWRITDAAGFTGDQSMWIENYVLDIQEIYEVYSTPFDLSDVPDGLNVYLSFKYAYTGLEGENDDRLRLYMSTNCGETWSLKSQYQSDELITAPLTLENFIPASNAQWQQEIYEVNPADHDPAVAFKFWFRNDNGNNIYIDDINIWSAETHVDELEGVQSFVVFPNPTDGITNLKVTTSAGSQLDIRLFDLHGRLVLSDQWNVPVGQSSRVLDLSSMSQGIYTLQLSDGLGSITQKLVR